MNQDPPLIRSLFFAPANRPELVAKFPRFDADASVIDLEDGTPPADKAAARDGLTALVASLDRNAWRGLLLVRVNEPASPHHAADVAAALACGADGLVVPKIEDPAALRATAQQAAAHGRLLVGGIESMAGVVHAQALCAAHPAMQAVYFGAEDFASDLGARRTPAGLEVLHARSHVVLHAKAAGLVAIDQAVLQVRDDAQFEACGRLGRDLGYDGKICVIPRQVALAHGLFGPTASELDHAARLVAAYDAALARGIGTIDFEGQMVDGPLLKRSQRLLAQGQRLAGR